jgi:membrane-associated phospholipid phosphatase
MFQTEFHIWLQSFSTPWLDNVWLFISAIGLQLQTQAILVVIVFAVSYRKGMLLLLLVVWNTLITEWFKELFSYPRPYMVDNAVRGIEIGETGDLAGKGATSFWGLLDSETLAQARTELNYHNWGIPSGHTTGTVTLWGGILSLFRNKWVWALAIALIVLIPFSRLYLGMHFLADVLAGYLLGAILLAIFIRSVFHNQQLSNVLFGGKPQPLNHKAALVLMGITTLTALAFWALGAPYSRAALVVGIQTGCFLVWLRGIPLDRGTIKERVFRTLLALVWTVLVIGIGETIDDAAVVKAHAWLDFLVNAAMYTVLIVGATELNVKMKWLHRLA